MLTEAYQLEQLSKGSLDHIEEVILSVVEDHYRVSNVFVVGSFTFGLEKVRDIDIVVCVREELSRRDGDVFIDELSPIVSKILMREVTLIPSDIMRFMNDGMKPIGIPYYNLTSRVWVNKSPGQTHNKYVLCNEETTECWFVGRDSSEGMYYSAMKDD